MASSFEALKAHDEFGKASACATRNVVGEHSARVIEKPIRNAQGELSGRNNRRDADNLSVRDCKEMHNLEACRIRNTLFPRLDAYRKEVKDQRTKCANIAAKHNK